jgi:hypothetical protein
VGRLSIPFLCPVDPFIPRFVNVFFRQERLPIAEGWKRSPVLIDVKALDSMSQDIVAASQWKANATQVPSIAIKFDSEKIVNL